MRNRYDQFGKQMLRTALEGHCTIETDAELPAETRRIDLWFMPREPRAALAEHLGLLGTIASRAGTIELFHNAPDRHALVACLIKHGELRLDLPRRAAAPPLPLPIQWIISSGRPDGSIEGFAFRPLDGWPPGIYEGPPQLWTRLVVVNELPIARNTLMLRLLGAGAVLRRAIAELKALPPDAPERMLAFPLLVQFRLIVESEPGVRTPEDEEFLMDTANIVEMWRQLAVQEGVIQGLKQGLVQGIMEGLEQGREEGRKEALDQSLTRERNLLLRQLRQRFGQDVDDAAEQRVAAASAGQIEAWLACVVSAATLAELLARTTLP